MNEKQVIPEAAVEDHRLISLDGSGWGCCGCDWTGELSDYWAKHETRRRNDNIPF